MEVVKEDKSAQEAIVKIKISPEDYDGRVSESLKEYKRTVALKGFRKGMVPSGVVKKMFGNQVLADELNKIIQEQLGQFLEAEKIDLLGDPLPIKDKENDIDIQNPGEYEFAFELGLAPNIELNALDNEPIFTKHAIIIEDSMVEDEIVRLQKQHGEMTNPDALIEAGDVVYAHLQELDESGAIKEGGIENKTPLEYDIFKADLQQQLLKAKPGDQVSVSLDNAFEKSDHDIAHHILGLKEHNLSGVGNDFQMTIEKINRVIPSPVDEAFVQKAMGPGVSSESEMRDIIKQELANYFDKDTERKLEADLVERLIDETKMEFPNDFLKRWLKATNEEKMTTEQIDQEYGYFERNLRWSLIIKKISADNDIKVDPENIRTHVKTTVLPQYGIVESEQFPPEAVNSMIDRVLSDEEQLKKIYDTLLEEKLFSWIKSKIQTKKKEVTLDQYKELINK